MDCLMLEVWGCSFYLKYGVLWIGYSNWCVSNCDNMLFVFTFEHRIKFYTQEIVFFRQDLLYRMRRSCLIPPSTEETEDPFEHVCFFSQPHPMTPSILIIKVWLIDYRCCIIRLTFCEFLLQLVATITHQSHLCPLPLMVQPIIWNYDHSLHLYPTPHTVLLTS